MLLALYDAGDAALDQAFALDDAAALGQALAPYDDDDAAAATGETVEDDPLPQALSYVAAAGVAEYWTGDTVSVETAIVTVLDCDQSAQEEDDEVEIEDELVDCDQYAQEEGEAEVGSEDELADCDQSSQEDEEVGTEEEVLVQSGQTGSSVTVEVKVDEVSDDSQLLQS